MNMHPRLNPSFDESGLSARVAGVSSVAGARSSSDLGTCLNRLYSSHKLDLSRPPMV